METKPRGTNARSIENRRLIKKMVRMLKEGKLVNEKSLKVDRQKFKTMISTIKKDHSMDVLTINRGHKTIGWILADEIL